MFIIIFFNKKECQNIKSQKYNFKVNSNTSDLFVLLFPSLVMKYNDIPLYVLQKFEEKNSKLSKTQ